MSTGPLHQAAEDGDYERISMLLAGKADVNAVNLNSMTPLYAAALNVHDTCVLVL
jgi:ankyrin repeat protein